MTPDKLLREAQGLFSAGRLGEAEARLETLLQRQPEHGEGLHLAALVALNAGDAATALSRFRRAAAVADAPATWHANLCEAERRAGNSAEAVRAGREAVRRAPRSAAALNNLAIALQEAGRAEESLAFLDRALALEPQSAMTHSNRGNTLQRLERHRESIAAHRKALELSPEFARGWSNLAMALNRLEEWEEGETAARRALGIAPESVEALTNLAVSLRGLRRLEEAVRAINRALQLAPRHAPAREVAAGIHREEGRLNEALAEARRAVALRTDADTLNTLGGILHALGEAEQAARCYREAIALSPERASLHNSLGHALLDQGHFEEAEAAVRKALSLRPSLAEAFLTLSYVRRFTAEDAEPEQMQTLLEEQDPQAPGAAREGATLHYVLGRALQDRGQPEEAFGHFREGARLKRAGLNHDPDAEDRRVAEIMEAFTGDTLERLAGGGDPSQQPVFILGMPRSGTSLVEQILASHPEVIGAGELPDLSSVANQAVRDGAGKALAYPRYLDRLKREDTAALGAAYLRRVLQRLPDGPARFTDKMPANFFFLGLIHLALPGARVIHCARDPLDTCLSCYTTPFSGRQDFSYDLEELGRFYNGYRRLMDHWARVLPEGSFLTVHYEDLVEDLEGWTARILRYCELPWDDACLSFHETRRSVRTASLGQVRQPLYRSSIGRWKQYEAQLQPLIRILE